MPAFDVPGNLAFDTYSELVAAIDDWLDRADLSGSAQQMIALCEARLRRELQPFFAETSATVAVVDGMGALPSGCDIIRLVEYDGGELQQVTLTHGRQFPSSDDSTAPRGFTLERGAIYVWPAVDCTITVIYKPKLTALTEAAPTNDLLSEHPDIYFFGSLMFANGYVADDNRAALFKGLWDESIAECKRFLGRQKWVNVRLRGPASVV